MIVYRVNDLYATIQGEGVMTGVPMLLVRFHGCGVHCHFCDTRETWEHGNANPRDQQAGLDLAQGTSSSWAACTTPGLVAAIDQERAGRPLRWVLLTGGEPAEQPLRPLVRALHVAGYKVALETSGTAQGHLPADGNEGDDCDWVCVSPKPNNPGGRALRAAAMQSADELKMVIGRESDFELLDELLAFADFTGKVSLQPMSESERATALCIEAALARGFRLSIQTHKTAGVR